MLQDSIKMLTYGRLSEGFHQFIKDEYPAIDISLASNKQELLNYSLIAMLLPDLTS
jgi:hypothetical protein